MAVFTHILIHNLIPIFVLIVVGFYMAKKHNIQMETLTKLNLYVFVPSFTFTNIYSTKMPRDMAKVVAVIVLVMLGNWLIGQGVSRVRGYTPSLRNAFSNSIMFYNSGNIGIPLITLVFGSKPFLVGTATPYLDLALTIQILVLMVQDVSTNTWGVFNANHAAGWRVALRKALRMPTLYAVSLAFLLKAIPFDFTSVPVWPALVYAKSALVPIALLTLGAQVARTPFRITRRSVWIAAVIRLLAGPALAYGLVRLMGLDGVVAQVLVISSAVPTAVNTALIAIEFGNEPEFSSQSVLVSTNLCAITLTFVIWMAGVLFPVG